MRQWASIIGEVGCIQHLNARVLLPVEGRHDWLRLPAFTTQFEGNLGVIEPEAQVVLMRRRECRGRATGRDGESLLIEDAAYRYATSSAGIGLQITLIPCNPKRLIRNFKYKEIIAGVGS